jgi:hypothetical protein
VAVRVHEPRHDDHPRRVDLLRPGHPEVTSDFDDGAILDEDIAVRDVPDVGIHRDDEAVADQKALRAHAPLLLGLPDTDCAG